MQVENLQNVPKLEPKPYLRVAAIDKKTTYGYLYIGNDKDNSQLLRHGFKSGYTVTNLEGAKSILNTEASSHIDVIIIDVAYHQGEMRAFQHFITSRSISNIPVLYNDSHFRNHSNGEQLDVIDDIIDLNNWQFDFYNKVTFLKKIKENGRVNQPEKKQDSPSRSVVKRIFDIIFAATLLLLLLPLFLLIALAIKLESRGPVFYTAKRAGRGFRIFSFYKFRTMVVNADKKIQDLAHLNQYSDCTNGPTFFKISNDPRITRIGKFLRNTSLDELPQLLNVLKGDMSLVGNRPLPLYEAATLTTNDFVERFMAPAGITGLWQIKKRGRDEMSAEERINLDISYARKSNLMYDLWIMVNTPKALFQKNNV